MAVFPDPNLGPVMVLVTGVTHAILLPLFAGRLYVRLVPDCHLSWDGSFLIAAVVRTYLSFYIPHLPSQSSLF